MKRLACPYCGSDLDFELTYTARYSDFRELTGIECANFACLARWKPSGEVEKLPKDADRPPAREWMCRCNYSNLGPICTHCGIARHHLPSGNAQSEGESE